MARKITHPLFGELKWDYGWSGEIRLPFFSTFDERAFEIVDQRCRERHKRPLRQRTPREINEMRHRNNGWFHLHLLSDDSVLFNDSKERPSAEQEQVFRFLIENETRVGNAVVEGVIEAYPAFCEVCREVEEQYYKKGSPIAPIEDLDEIVPRKITRKKLQDLIQLVTVYIHRSHLQEFARVGFSFHCTWDEEHGLGVLTQKDNVVEVGQMDIAF